MKREAVEATKQARERADKLLDREHIPPVHKAYLEMSGGFLLGLSRLFRGRTRERLALPTAPEIGRLVISPGTAVSQALVWAKRSFPLISESVGGALALTTQVTLEEGLRSVGATMRVLVKSPTPLDDSARVARIIKMHLRELEAMREHAAVNVAGDIHAALAKRLRSLPGDSRVSDLISLTGDVLDGEWWRIERIVRTETSRTYNTAVHTAIQDIAKSPEFAGLHGRWTEHVDDLTGRPLDNRVARDSLSLHGQVARPGGSFVMPAGANVPQQFLGGSWSHPPNRPNDRAVLTPWMHAWGIPAWMIRAGRRVSM